VSDVVKTVFSGIVYVMQINVIRIEEKRNLDKGTINNNYIKLQEFHTSPAPYQSAAACSVLRLRKVLNGT